SPEGANAKDASKVTKQEVTKHVVTKQEVGAQCRVLCVHGYWAPKLYVGVAISEWVLAKLYVVLPYHRGMAKMYVVFPRIWVLAKLYVVCCHLLVGMANLYVDVPSPSGYYMALRLYVVLPSPSGGYGQVYVVLPFLWVLAKLYVVLPSPSGYWPAVYVVLPSPSGVLDQAWVLAKLYVVLPSPSGYSMAKLYVVLPSPSGGMAKLYVNHGVLAKLYEVLPILVGFHGQAWVLAKLYVVLPLQWVLNGKMYVVVALSCGDPWPSKPAPPKPVEVKPKKAIAKNMKEKKGGAKVKEDGPSHNGQTMTEEICVSRSSVSVTYYRSLAPNSMSVRGQSETVRVN
ncbi:unnamed protein product, partial [Coregonus sp. 'balchen']